MHHKSHCFEHLNLGNLDLFRISILGFQSIDNSLPNLMIQSKTNNHLSIINNHLPMAPSQPKTSAISAFSAVKNSCLCVFCAFLWLKNPFNQRNPRLINDLRPCKALYNCRDTFTNVMDSLQISPLLCKTKPISREVK